MSPAMHSINYTPDDPWKIVRDTPWGDIPQWMASTLATGTMGAFDEYMRQFRQQFDQFRSNSNAELDKILMQSNEADARMKILRDVATQLTTAANQLKADRAAFEQERDAFAAMRDAEPLPSPPGEPSLTLASGNDRSPLQDASGPDPAGDLHVIPAKDPDELGALPADDDEPDVLPHVPVASPSQEE